MRFAPLAFLLLLFASPSAFAQYRWGRPPVPESGACFYRNANYRGDFFCMRDGERWASLPPGFRDTISSIRVFGGGRLRVFYGVNFTSVSLLVDHDINNLGNVRRADSRRNNWNDRISSIAVFRDQDDWAPRRR